MENIEQISEPQPQQTVIVVKHKSEATVVKFEGETRENVGVPPGRTLYHESTRTRPEEQDFLDSQQIRVQLTWKDVNVWPVYNSAATSFVRDTKKIIPESPGIEGKNADMRRAKFRDKSEDSLILKGVSGTVKPGQFLAIIGSTGAGKTTLLQYLSGKMFSQTLASKGEVLFNGIPKEQIDYSRFTAFVQQDDILMETLTVRESIIFAANVKGTGTPLEKEIRVNNLLKELELTTCADYYFSDDRLRKGEKKRASMGVELITNPALVFLDEPTTGMDSYTAIKIVELMRRLAEKGRTVIATIHQPNSDIFGNFDQLMIISLGHIVYFNAASKAVGYFHNQGFACPERTNPAEYFMKIMSAETFMKPEDGSQMLERAYERYKDSISQMAKAYKSPENQLRCDADTIEESQNIQELKQVAPWSEQFWYLLKRAMINTIRSPMATIARFVIVLFVMALGMSMYFQLTETGYEAMQGRIGAQFFMMALAFLEAIQNVILVFPEERAVFLRDQASSLYSVSAYFVSKVIAELPLNLIVPLVALLLAQWPWNLNNEHPYNFWINLINMELMYLSACGYGIVSGAIVSNRDTLISLVPVIVMPLLLLSGFFVKIGTSAHVAWVLHYLSPCKYGFTAGIKNEFEDSNVVVQTITPYGILTRTGNDIVDSLDLEPNNIWTCFGALVGLTLASHFVAYICLVIYGKRV